MENVQQSIYERESATNWSLIEQITDDSNHGYIKSN